MQEQFNTPSWCPFWPVLRSRMPILHRCCQLTSDLCAALLMTSDVCPVDRHRAERAELERRTAEGKWGLDGNPQDRREEPQARKGGDPFGMAAIEGTAAKYEARERMYPLQYMRPFWRRSSRRCTIRTSLPICFNYEYSPFPGAIVNTVCRRRCRSW